MIDNSFVSNDQTDLNAGQELAPEPNQAPKVPIAKAWLQHNGVPQLAVLALAFTAGDLPELVSHLTSGVCGH